MFLTAEGYGDYNLINILRGFAGLITQFFNTLSGIEIPIAPNTYLSLYTIMIVIILFNLGIFVIKRVALGHSGKIAGNKTKANTVKGGN